MIVEKINGAVLNDCQRLIKNMSYENFSGMIVVDLGDVDLIEKCMRDSYQVICAWGKAEAREIHNKIRARILFAFGPANGYPPTPGEMRKYQRPVVFIWKDDPPTASKSATKKGRK